MGLTDPVDSSEFDSLADFNLMPEPAYIVGEEAAKSVDFINVGHFDLINFILIFPVDFFFF
jgi:hypothetical protein